MELFGLGGDSKEVKAQCQETHALWAEVTALAPQTESGSVDYKSTTLLLLLAESFDVHYLLSSLIFRDLQCKIDTAAHIRLAQDDKHKELVIAVGPDKPDKMGTPELQVVLNPATYKLRGVRVKNPDKKYTLPVSKDPYTYQPVTEQGPALDLLSLIKVDLKRGRDRWESQMAEEKYAYLEGLAKAIDPHAKTATEILIAQMEQAFPDDYYFITLGLTPNPEEGKDPVIDILTTLDIDEETFRIIGDQYKNFRQPPYAESQDYHLQYGDWRGYFTQKYDTGCKFSLSLSDLDLPNGHSIYLAEENFAEFLAGKEEYNYGLDTNLNSPQPILLCYHTPGRSFLTPKPVEEPAPEACLF